MLLGYTYSKAIDNVGEMTSVAGTRNGFQDNYCFACDRSLSDQNEPYSHAAGARAMSCRSGRARPCRASGLAGEGVRRMVAGRFLHRRCRPAGGRFLAQ